MASSVRAIMEQRDREALLIARIGFNIQHVRCNPGEGITRYRLYKNFALILRHWELLRKYSPGYGGILRWSLQHGPHRNGEVVFRLPGPMDGFSSDHPYKVMFLDQIILSERLLVEN